MDNAEYEEYIQINEQIKKIQQKHKIEMEIIKEKELKISKLINNIKNQINDFWEEIYEN